MAQGHKTGGRQKGTSNKATTDIKAAFQKHGPALVKALIALTKSKDERIRLGAVQACLDRGWGKSTQAVEVGGETKERTGPRPDAPSKWAAMKAEIEAARKEERKEARKEAGRPEAGNGADGN